MAHGKLLVHLPLKTMPSGRALHITQTLHFQCSYVLVPYLICFVHNSSRCHIHLHFWIAALGGRDFKAEANEWFVLCFRLPGKWLLPFRTLRHGALAKNGSPEFIGLAEGNSLLSLNYRTSPA